MTSAIRVIVAICFACTPAIAQTQPAEPASAAAISAAPAPSGKRSPFDDSELARLASLKPANPSAYLELGEDMLDSPDSPERVDMIRQLLVRALEYGRLRPDQRRTAASASIALASMSKREGDRLWLRSVAAILEPSSVEFAPARRAKQQESQAAANRASLFLTQLRAGAGIEARDSLAAKGVRAVLEQHERELSAGGTISVPDLEAESKKWPCTDCGSTGIIVPPKGQHGSAKLCPVCGGQPGMKLNPADFAAQLRLQRRLAGSTSEPWGSLIETEGAPPARDPDPANVAPAFAVDVRLSVWRDGQWATPEPQPAAP